MLRQTTGAIANGDIASTTSSSTVAEFHGSKYPGHVSVISDGYRCLCFPISVANRDPTSQLHRPPILRWPHVCRHSRVPTMATTAEPAFWCSETQSAPLRTARSAFPIPGVPSLLAFSVP